MTIRPAHFYDLTVLTHYDHHVSPDELESLIRRNRVYVAEENGIFTGWLRWNLFWDNTPFMNLLFLLEDLQGKGYGKDMVAHWEEEMKHRGYRLVMTSIASDEYAQHFYRKLGYAAIGGFTFPNDPYELIFAKTL